MVKWVENVMKRKEKMNLLNANVNVNVEKWDMEKERNVMENVMEKVEKKMMEKVEKRKEDVEK